jgi:flavin reductase (DIM6/NTAB) family NADH-FMN oxidoreductase RutF
LKESSLNRQPIPIELCEISAFQPWEQWFLLTSGDFASAQYNMMTVSWGMLGVMWNKPIAQVVVRPTRHTYSLIEKHPDFTLTAFSNEFRPVLSRLGAKSGRDIDKINHSGLTPVQSSTVAAPAFAEAELVIECRKVYYDDLNPDHFLAAYIDPEYQNDYHRIYYGEILALQGTQKYRRKI